GGVHVLGGLVAVVMRRRVIPEGAGAHMVAVGLELQDLAPAEPHLQAEGEARLLHRAPARWFVVHDNLPGCPQSAGPAALQQAAWNTAESSSESKSSMKRLSFSVRSWGDGSRKRGLRSDGYARQIAVRARPKCGRRRSNRRPCQFVQFLARPSRRANGGNAT